MVNSRHKICPLKYEGETLVTLYNVKNILIDIYIYIYIYIFSLDDQSIFKSQKIK